MTTARGGFTLVELSIVLVIVGLLIGGILVGQSLIESAKINKEVSRLSQYAVAVVQFKEKFKQEAGDSDFFEPKGDDDGDTDNWTGTCPTQNLESLTAWSHLSQVGMLTGETYVWTENPTPICSNNYVGATPTNKIAADGNIYPYYYFTKPSGYNIGGNYQRLFDAYYDPEILWGLENKLDDGVPSQSTGRIMSSTYAGGYVCDPTNVTQDVVIEGEQYRFCAATIYFNESLN